MKPYYLFAWCIAAPLINWWLFTQGEWFLLSFGLIGSAMILDILLRGVRRG